MIHIIDKVSLTSNGLVATGTKDLIHLHQGDMDGACAVYSLMMCLISNRSIKRLDVTDLDKKHDGRSSKGRLMDTFLNNAKGLVREGYELEVLNTELLHAFKKCVSTAWYSTENAIYLPHGDGVTHDAGRPDYRHSRLGSGHRRGRSTWCPCDGTEYSRQDPRSTP